MNNLKLWTALMAGVTLLSLGALYMRDQGLTKPAANFHKTRYEAMADEINGSASAGWTAVARPTIAHDPQTLKRMFSLVIDAVPAGFDAMPTHMLASDELPESFDAREHWPQCAAIKEIRDQSACGSCWAFGAASAMSDRLCIHSGQKDQRRVSSEDIMECCGSCGNGCNGGYLYATWMYWKGSGVVTGGLYGDKSTCKPYALPPCNHHSTGPYDDCGKHHYDTPACQRKCENESYKKLYNDDKIFADRAYAVSSDEDSIRKELFENGSLEAAFSVYEDFLLYKSGVYTHKTGGFLGGHAIKVIGWGVENGNKYWLCVNSWNESWGDKGTFKILRGNNHCGIESGMVGGIPKL